MCKQSFVSLCKSFSFQLVRCKQRFQISNSSAVKIIKCLPTTIFSVYHRMTFDDVSWGKQSFISLCFNKEYVNRVSKFPTWYWLKSSDSLPTPIFSISSQMNSHVNYIVIYVL